MSRKVSLRQLTIRGFEPEVEAHIRALARRERLSLNQAVMQLLRRAAGVAAAKDQDTDCIGTSLDFLAGTWNADDERQFNDAVEPLERVDAGFWGAGAASKRSRRQA